VQNNCKYIQNIHKNKIHQNISCGQMRRKRIHLRKNAISEPFRGFRKKKLRRYQQESNVAPIDEEQLTNPIKSSVFVKKLRRHQQGPNVSQIDCSIFRNGRRYLDTNDSPSSNEEQIPNPDEFSDMPELASDVESDDDSHTNFESRDLKCNVPHSDYEDNVMSDSHTDFESRDLKCNVPHSDYEDNVMSEDEDDIMDIDTFHEFCEEQTYVASIASSSDVLSTAKVGYDDHEDGECDSLSMLNTWLVSKAATPHPPPFSPNVVSVSSGHDIIASAICTSNVLSAARVGSDDDRESGFNNHGVLNTTLGTTPFKVIPIGNGEDAEYHKDLAEFCNNKIERDSIKEVNSYLQFHI
jgi:hypothetical protein